MRILTSPWTFALVAMGGAAAAQETFEGLETIGKPVDRGVNFQPAATELMRDLVFLDNMIL